MSLIQASEETLALIYKEFGTNQTRVTEDVQLLKTWLHQQPHLPHLEDDFVLENMLVRCKCSVERAKRAWDMHFTLKTALPEFFGNRDPMSPALQRTMKIMTIAPLPRLTKDGYRVTVLKAMSKDATDFKPELFYKFSLMLGDLRFMEDKSVGDVYVYDLEHVTMGHVTRVTLPMLKKLELICAEGYRARIKGVHFVNAPAVVEVLMGMVKAVLKSKLASRHHTHVTMDSLYDFIERDLLPKEYGGAERPLEEIAEGWRKKAESYRDWFLEQEIVGKADESKRPGKTFNTSEFFGFEGTFKKLSVD